MFVAMILAVFVLFVIGAFVWLCILIILVSLRAIKILPRWADPALIPGVRQELARRKALKAMDAKAAKTPEAEIVAMLDFTKRSLDAKPTSSEIKKALADFDREYAAGRVAELLYPRVRQVILDALAYRMANPLAPVIREPEPSELGAALLKAREEAKTAKVASKGGAANPYYKYVNLPDDIIER